MTSRSSCFWVVILSTKQEVIIGVGSNGDRARMWVEDEGPGIPEKERQRVWEPFYRLHGNGHVATTGTGIGLAVVRDLVERQGGRCHVESGRGSGARLVVEFPHSAEVAEGAE